MLEGMTAPRPDPVERLRGFVRIANPADEYDVLGFTPPEATALLDQLAETERCLVAAKTIHSQLNAMLSNAQSTIAAQDKRIAGLREALEKIAPHRYGLDMNDDDRAAAKYWSGLVLEYREYARRALAESGEKR